MRVFFLYSAVLSSVLLITSLVIGHIGASLGLEPFVHMLFGLTATLVAVSLHCLIFGIFTGSGKDTRELVQDLSLKPESVGETKAFRRHVFPAALYSILLLVMTSILGGARSSFSGIWLVVHPTLAWFSIFYNIKSFILEYKAVRDNALILERVNKEASAAIAAHPEEAKKIPEIAGHVNAATTQLEWNAHVFALGKFLCFLGWNAWLPYIYLRFIVGYFRCPVWPFLLTSLLCLAGGYYLRLRYRPQGMTSLELSQSPS